MTGHAVLPQDRQHIPAEIDFSRGLSRQDPRKYKPTERRLRKSGSPHAPLPKNETLPELKEGKRVRRRNYAIPAFHRIPPRHTARNPRFEPYRISLFYIYLRTLAPA